MTRLNSYQRGYGPRWEKYREKYLAHHPRCVMCEAKGQLGIAAVVDHIVPPRMAEALRSGCAETIAKARKLFWDPANHQPLCSRCHDSDKQRLEKSGRVAGCDASGIPIDPNHHWHSAQG
jgi:5-methylcytosine-specific restriction endonuclease McrA